MKNLFVIDGTSGTGKSDMIKFVQDFRTDVSLVKKYTTRDQRSYEEDPARKLDLVFVSRDEFDDYGLEDTYVYNREWYGFHKRDLDASLSRSGNVFVIVRSAPVIEALTRDYDFINVIPVFVYTDADEIAERLAREDLTEEQIQFRLSRVGQAFEDYVRHPEIYREVLINNSSTAVYHQLIEKMLDRYEAAPDVKDDLIFVLMSFDRARSSLQDYYSAMKRAVAQHDDSLYCERLDEIGGSYRISDTAKRRIQQCRLAIVDLTGNSPNVYYELGFAHGIGKRILLTAHEDTKQLFYPGEYKIIYYKNATDLEEKLKRELAAALGSL